MEKGRPPGRLRHSWEARCRLVAVMLSGVEPQAAAAVCGMSRATAYRLLRRYQEGGWDGLRDRPPIPLRCPHRLSAEVEAQIVQLRRRTGWGPRSLSAVLGWPPSTIWRVLKRHGCSRQERMPRPAANRYEYAAPGELVHLDIKQLGRFWQVGKRVHRDGVGRNPGAGWQYAHVAIDDHSRLAQVELRASQRGQDCAAFARAVIAAYNQRGTPIQRILTDNGSGYRSATFATLLRQHGIRHIRTRPYRPRTNGNAEAFIRILQREWAYAYIYPSSAHRAKALPGWTRWYNNHRPHGGIGGQPPLSRVSHAAGSYT
jgi:transposase InsO family protein